MFKNWMLNIIIILIVAFAVYLLFPRPTGTITLKIKNQDFVLETAKTIPQQAKGLMNRTTLCPNCGMIFIFGLSMPQTFWMKDTLIPLDMIFLDENGQVVTITTANPQPNTPDKDLTLYRSTGESKYVIELNAGTAKKINLRVGDKISLPSTL